MKVLVMPESLDQAKDLINIVDGIIVGIEGLSTNMASNFSISHALLLSDLAHKNKKEIFISLNKNMHSSDLGKLEDVMIKLESYVTGIIYYDMSVLNLKNRLALKVDLVWNQEHLTTNSLASDFFYDNGVKYTWISSDITLDEVKEIKENSKSKLMMMFFGYIPIMVSKRNLISNYKETFKIKDNSNIYYFELDDNYYPVIDNKDGTSAFSSSILNGIEESYNLQLDYAILNSLFIDNTKFKEVAYMFMNMNEENIKEYKERIFNMFNTNSGFFYKKTVYKVKKDD